MKSNKVLIGLFAGVFALTGGMAQAQFYEIGPANIGGHISSLVVDQQDPSLSTVYAGAMSGGLYVRSSNSDVLHNLYADIEGTAQYNALISNMESWHLVRYIDRQNGYEVTLPVSALAQLPNGTILVGTGDDTYPQGSTYGKMSHRGKGVFLYKPSEGTFTLIPSTNPENNDLFAAVHAIDWLYRDNVLYVYVATNTGLYRWIINDMDDESEWSNSATPIKQGSIDQLLVIRNLNIAYFTIGNQLYRISDLTVGGSQMNPVNISSTNPAFGGTNTSIKLAVSPTDNRYLYAMVIRDNGAMENVYMTTNGQTWNTLTTSSVTPFLFSTAHNEDGTIDTTSYTNGNENGTIVVDPTNPRRIILGGTTLWVGEGFLEGGVYQWTKNSYSEYELNSGDYMSDVFNSSIYVHSGINQIVSTYHIENGVGYNTYYIATNAGVFSTSTNFYSYDNINRGMNSVQINSIAVTPDGSIISGANNNACPFIESRMAHNGGSPILSWYDDGSLGNMNHDANILWTGNGGKVAASAFQQLSPNLHRNIFVSSGNGRIGRSFNDYLDYTNNQTWTVGTPLLTTAVTGGPVIGNISLWETSDENHGLKDSLKVGLDLSGYFFSASGDSVKITDANQVIPAGSKAVFLCKENSEYPFEYTFTKAQKAGDSIVVKKPVLSRMLAVVDLSTNQSGIILTWTPNDFSKIYDSITDNDRDLDANVKTALRAKFMWWAPLQTISRNYILNTKHLYPREGVMSRDGLCVYTSTYDDSLHRSQLYRINGMEKVNFYQYPAQTRREMNSGSDTTERVLRTTKFLRNGTNEWFNRPISSISVDPRPGQDRIVLTFEDFSDGYANVAVINNPSSADWNNNITALPISVNGVSYAGIPAYSAMVEQNTGNIYVGTSEGVFVYNGSTWSQYDELHGVAVTSIVQQNRDLPARRVLTHTGINENKYLFAKTKWPGAIYFGTYGRGIFMDMSYVTDTVNEVSDSVDRIWVSIPTVASVGQSSVSVYPNPVMGEARLSLNAAEAGEAILRVYDLNGRMVNERRLGYANEGEQIYSISTDGMSKGMYLINVIIGGHTAATKMLVR